MPVSRTVLVHLFILSPSQNVCPMLEDRNLICLVPHSSVAPFPGTGWLRWGMSVGVMISESLPDLLCQPPSRVL